MKIIVQSIFISLIFASSFTVSGAEVSPLDTPPEMTNLEEEPAVTSGRQEQVQRGEQTIQEGGQTEVRVTNKVGTYIVKPNQAVGTSLPGDAQSSNNNAVQWVVKSWRDKRQTDSTSTPPELKENPDATK